MIIDEIRETLFQLKDEKYKEFQSKLIPTVDKEKVIGVRTPALRAYAKQMLKREDLHEFLENFPHKYYDENQLHACILTEVKDFHNCIEKVHAFLPYVDNWATCDQMVPKVFKKHRRELLPYIKVWISSEKTYEIRYGIKMLMDHFLEEEFLSSYPEAIAKIQSEEYYVNMMIAWYFATALAKRYKEIIPFIENKRLNVWVHNKTIQKAIESYRITKDQKEYLIQLKIR